MLLKALKINLDSDKAGMSYKALGRKKRCVEYLKKAAFCGSDDTGLRNIGIDLR